MTVAELERYDPHQPRGYHGRWGHEPFDMDGFDLIAKVEGTFGDLEMGVSDVGDVRMAFQEHGHIRALDLGGTEVRQLHSALEALERERDDFGTDGSADDLIDEHWFGHGEEHKAALLGNGLIEVVFGAEEDDPWTLQLDPPHHGEDDVQQLLDGLDDVLNELPDDDAERANVSTAGIERAYSPESGPAAAPTGPPKGGQFATGGGRVTGKGKPSKSRRTGSGSKSGGAKKAAPPDPNLHFDGKTGTGYGVKGGDARVRTLQQALNRLGLKDRSGNELAVDGRYGPRTTSSVKKLQKALGLPVDGKVTPELLKQASELKQLPEKPHKTPKPAPRQLQQQRRRVISTTVRSRILGTVARALGEHRVVDGVCVGCQPSEDPDEEAVRALVDALDEVMRLRYVRTAAGAKKYGVPIGSVIGGGSDHKPNLHAPHAPHTPAQKPSARDASTFTSADKLAAAKKMYGSDESQWPKRVQRDAAKLRQPPKTPAPAKRQPRTAKPTLKDRLVSAIDDHLNGKGDGKPLAGFNREQLRKAAKERGIALDRGEHEDSIVGKLIAHARGDAGDSPATPSAVKAAPKKAAASKRGPKPKTSEPKRTPPPAGPHPDEVFKRRSAGKDLMGSDPAPLARRVVAGRDAQHAADHSLAVIGHEQGFDAKPRVVSKAEMDRLVAEGHTETFRGVGQRPGGPTGAEIHEEMRSGHAYYGNGIYGNGYYWGEHRIAKMYSDDRPGSVARAVISPNAKIADFYGPGGKDLGGLDEEHTKFLAGIDDPELLEVYGDIGRYAAARGYDVIRINQKNGEPFYNVLNRSALVVEEAS